MKNFLSALIWAFGLLWLGCPAEETPPPGDQKGKEVFFENQGEADDAGNIDDSNNVSGTDAGHGPEPTSDAGAETNTPVAADAGASVSGSTDAGSAPSVHCSGQAVTTWNNEDLGGTYCDSDLQFLQDLIDNSGLDIGVLALGTQTWVNGRLLRFKANEASLSGALPASLTGVDQLMVLDLQSNEISGSLPDDIGVLTSLTLLKLGDNQLTGTLPDSLGQLAKITLLSLQSNDLEGVIPDSLGQITYLVNLNLSRNNLTGGIPSSLGGLNNLRYLYLYQNVHKAF